MTTFNLHEYSPNDHANILITSRNHSTIAHPSDGSSISQVSGMNPKAFLFKISRLQEEHGEEIEALATAVVKVTFLHLCNIPNA